ncbi:GDYXXLXY domain-containing protein [Massilia sp. CCM 9210]|uniref:GDYXXLXY domain-containing protein n=1 Tax=Massilia scottii TaxID=3057166 RepID=UPI00279689A3|nr:GDYXXLXY domain-containing protein [Massilia sp. CCM 9210]MDQ1818161.1 GDYXXLXY domain-containing protein [Massilia sp. CCM 9210]
MKRSLNEIIADAIATGILPASAATFIEHEEHRPWPVVLLTALGAWLAAIPLMGIIFLLCGDILARNTGALYPLSLILCGVAVAILRRASLPLFIEQLAIPALLAGAATMSAAFYIDMSIGNASASVALLAIALAVLIPRNWLRVLLGAISCAFIMAAIVTLAASRDRDGYWMVVHGAMGIWLVADFVQRQHLRSVLVDRLATGWVLTIIAGLVLWTGMTFLVGAAIHGGSAGTMDPLTQPLASLAQFASAALTLGGAAWLAMRWPALRKPWYALTAAVFTGLAVLMPSLGAVLMILALCVSSGRWGIAAAAGAAAAWIMGALYYQLAYPLATKALILIGAGALFALIAWLAIRDGAPVVSGDSATPARNETHAGRIGIALTAFAVLAIANIGIWQKESLIANGRPVLVELAPVDPRSLMQGDYMRLNFNLPQEVSQMSEGETGSARLKVAGTVNEKGIVELTRLHDGTPLAPGEIVIELTPRHGGHTLVTDAWYFQEGEAKRWEAAKYGEFRVDANGKALLVGMRGANLEAL